MLHHFLCSLFMLVVTGAKEIWKSPLDATVIRQCKYIVFQTVYFSESILRVSSALKLLTYYIVIHLNYFSKNS